MSESESQMTPSEGTLPPVLRPDPSTAGFLVHAAVALLALVVLNAMITYVAPFRVQGMGEFYLIFYYHFPGAMNCFLFFGAVMVFSILFLQDGRAQWDRHAKVAGEVGLVACTVTLVTGSVWAKSAWNVWWAWNDPRLMSAAIMWLTYAGYVVLQTQMEDHGRRRRFAAVFGILAALNIPFVHYSIKWLGEGQHPMKITRDSGVAVTQWYSVVAFLIFYSLLYHWKVERERVREAVEQQLARVRRLEEGA